MSKYSVPKDHWEKDEQPEPNEELPARVDVHAVKIHHKTDPDRPNGYRYVFHISHGHRWDPIAIPLEKERWAGNFWRKCEDLDDRDWENVPHCVKEELVEVVAGADSVRDLSPMAEDME